MKLVQSLKDQRIKNHSDEISALRGEMFLSASICVHRRLENECDFLLFLWSVDWGLNL